MLLEMIIFDCENYFYLFPTYYPELTKWCYNILRQLILSLLCE